MPRYSESQRDQAAEKISKLNWTLENEPLRFFTPHGGQLEVIRQLERPDAFIVVSGAGNGWGKSELLAAIFASAMWPEIAPPCLQFLKNWKHPKRARIYSKPAELEEIGSLQTAIKELFPKDRYLVSKGRYSYPSVYTSDTGWVLDLFSYERDHSEAAGPNIGLQAFNEPPPEKLWNEGIARSRAGGVILGGMTSLLDNVWVVDGIFAKHDGASTYVRYGSSCENCIQHGTNGNLEHANIERILNQYDPDEREARFTGKPLTFSGRILKGFERGVHVAQQEFEPPQNGVSLGMTCDPAIGKPLFMLWRYVDAMGVKHYYDEWPNFPFEGSKDSNLTVSDYVAIIKQKDNERKIDSRILDRHFGNTRRTLGGQTLKQEFAEAGIEFRDSYTMDNEVETGILKIKQELRYDREKPISSTNYPRIVISPRCKNLITSMERWSRDPKTAKVQEQFKDPIDCLRYDVMSNPVIEQERPWDQYRRAHYGVGQD